MWHSEGKADKREGEYFSENDGEVKQFYVTAAVLSAKGNQSQ